MKRYEALAGWLNRTADAIDETLGDDDSVTWAWNLREMVKEVGALAADYQGAVGAIAKISERAEHDRSKGRDVSCDWLKRVTADALSATEGR
jgi:hypothetical protein